MSVGYLTTFSGEVGLNDKADPAALSKISLVIDGKFPDLMTLNSQTKTLYIKGEYDNKDNLVEKFLIKIYPLLDVGEGITVKAQGQDLKDRWDIVITDAIYIQEYKLVKEELRKYE